MTKYTIKPTGQFKKDFKLAQKRHLDTSLLKEIINKRVDLERLKDIDLFVLDMDVGAERKRN